MKKANLKKPSVFLSANVPSNNRAYISNAGNHKVATEGEYAMYPAYRWPDESPEWSVKLPIAPTFADQPYIVDNSISVGVDHAVLGSSISCSVGSINTASGSSYALNPIDLDNATITDENGGNWKIKIDSTGTLRTEKA
jgi:hypothetical protein